MLESAKSSALPFFVAPVMEEITIIATFLALEYEAGNVAVVLPSYFAVTLFVFGLLIFGCSTLFVYYCHLTPKRLEPTSILMAAAVLVFAVTPTAMSLQKYQDASGFAVGGIVIFCFGLYYFSLENRKAFRLSQKLKSFMGRVEFWVTVIGLVVALIGFYLSGLSLTPELGYSLIDVGVGACVVAILVSALHDYERRKQWKRVEERVVKRIRKEIEQTVIDLVFLLKAHPLSTVPISDPNSLLEAKKAYSTGTLEQMNDMWLEVRDNWLQQLEVLSNDTNIAVKLHALLTDVFVSNEKAYGTVVSVVKEHMKRFGELQCKYSSVMDSDWAYLIITFDAMLNDILVAADIDKKHFDHKQGAVFCDTVRVLLEAAADAGRKDQIFNKRWAVDFVWLSEISWVPDYRTV